MENGKNGPARILVIPGELLSDGELKAGKNTYRQGKKIYASQMGFKTVTSNYVTVIPLSGRYIPNPDDMVIGIIMSVSPTTWLVEINSPYPAPLHVTEVPWRVEFGETSRYLNSGDAILARVFTVDEIKRIQVTMKDQGSRKLSGGQIIEISPTKVPRVIGKGGSMISLIKQKTMCRLFVGQNGRIWIDGETEKIRIAVNAIHFIERESHRFGLTEAVEKYLKSETEKLEGKPIRHAEETSESVEGTSEVVEETSEIVEETSDIEDESTEPEGENYPLDDEPSESAAASKEGDGIEEGSSQEPEDTTTEEEPETTEELLESFEKIRE